MSVWEKFFNAIRILAIENKSIKERLYDAVVFNILILTDNDFSEEGFDDLRDQHKKLIDELTCVDALSDEGKLRATINKMSSEEASEIADKIVSMFNEMWRGILLSIYDEVMIEDDNDAKM